MPISFNSQSIILPQTNSQSVVSIGSKQAEVVQKGDSFQVEQTAEASVPDISVKEENEIEAEFVAVDQQSSELKNKLSPDELNLVDSNNSNQISSLSEQRLDVIDQQDSLRQDEDSIEQEIRSLEQIERQLDRRIAQLKQSQSVGSQIDVIA